MSIKRIKDLPEGGGSLTNDDIFLVMDDPSGSGVTKKISLSEIISAVGGSSNSLTIVAAPNWTSNHTVADGTRYLTNDVVYVDGSIYRALHDNESEPVTNTVYWENLGSGYRLNIDGRDIQNIPYPVKSVNGQTGDINIPQGPQGDQGPQGVQGNDGADGVQGNQGAQGSQGSQGSTGAQGSQGPQGSKGADGPQGVPGDPASNIVTSVNGKTGAVTIPVYPIRAYIIGGMMTLNNSSNNTYNVGLPITYSNSVPNFNYIPLKLFGNIEYGGTSINVSCQSNIDQALLDFPGTYVSYSSLEVVLIDANNKIVGWATSASNPTPMPTHGSDGYKLTINLFDFPDLTNVPQTWILTNPNPSNSFEGCIFLNPIAYKQISSRFIDNLEHNWNNIPNDPIKNIIAGNNVLITNNNGNFTITSSGIVSNPSGINGASAVTNIVKISQTNYNALSSYDPNTVYIIDS